MRSPQRRPRRVTPRRVLGVLAAAVVMTVAPASSTVAPYPSGAPRAVPGLSVAPGEAPAPEIAVVDPTRVPDAETVAATFPTRDDTGLPPGWEPKEEHTGDLWVSARGAVVEDLRITGGIIYVTGQDVTLRRVEAIDAFVVNDANGGCGSGLVVESSTFTRTTGATETDLPAIGNGGYTVRDTLIDGVPEGIRVGSKHCGGVTLENSYIAVVPPAQCQDWHGDGIQGHNGGPVLVRQSVITLEERADCPGNAPFFYPGDQGNTSLTVDGLLVSGGGYPFRAGTSGTVNNLRVIDDSWGYGPTEVTCPDIAVTGSHLVTLAADGSTTPVEQLAPCGAG